MGVAGQRSYAASAGAAQAQQNIYGLQAAQMGMYGDIIGGVSGMKLGTVGYNSTSGFSYTGPS